MKFTYEGAYEEGRKARSAGVRVSACPYVPSDGPTLQNGWRKGWYDQDTQYHDEAQQEQAWSALNE